MRRLPGSNGGATAGSAACHGTVGDELVQTLPANLAGQSEAHVWVIPSVASAYQMAFLHASTGFVAAAPSFCAPTIAAASVALRFDRRSIRSIPRSITSAAIPMMTRTVTAKRIA